MHTQGHPSLAEAFDLFLSQGPGRSLQADVKRIARRLRRLLSTSEAQQWPLTDLFHMDEMVLSSQGDKQRSAALVQDFYAYAAERYGVSFESVLKDMQLVDNPAERQIEMVKYLHTPRTRQEIGERFGLEPRTVRKDLLQLATGTRFLGVELRASFSGRDHTYRSSLHPVFLVMSLSQAYAATVGLLKLVDEDSDQYDFYLGLAAGIFKQLSGYARDRLRQQAPRETVLLERHEAGIVPEWQTHSMDMANRLMYLFKSGETATVSVLRGGQERVYEDARLRWKHGDIYTLTPRDGHAFDIRQGDVLALEDFTYR